MRFTRFLTLLVSTALIGLPALVVDAGAASAAEQLTTKLTMRTSYAKLQYKKTFDAAGELTAYDSTGAPRELNGPQTLTLERQFTGTSTWTPVATYSSYGSYYFSGVVALQNATYRVTFAGGTQHNYDTQSEDTLAPSSASTVIRVARTLGDTMVKKTYVAYLKGNVNPGWNHKVIHLQKRTCAKCAWHNVDKQTTSSTGAWKFKLGASHTKWFWRVYVDKSTQFVKSWSDYEYYTLRY